MFARVSVYEFPSDRMDDALHEFRGALDQISTLDGFSEAFFFMAAEDGRATATTFWTSRHALEASRSAASNLRTRAARAADGGVISAIEYEVGLHLEGPVGVGAARANPLGSSPGTNDPQAA